jgi:hypothetical protein
MLLALQFEHSTRAIHKGLAGWAGSAIAGSASTTDAVSVAGETGRATKIRSHYALSAVRGTGG